MPYSVVMAGRIARADAENGGVPYMSPSNQSLAITGMYLADGTEVVLDLDQANVVNSMGVVTAVNLNGWRTRGNYTGAYPSTNDPKDMWICVKRIFYWYRTSLILNYISQVDRPINKALIETFTDSERIRMSKYVSNGQIAGFKIAYEGDLNPITDVLAGIVNFSISLTPFTPAQEINGIVSFDVDMLESYLGEVAA